MRKNLFFVCFFLCAVTLSAQQQRQARFSEIKTLFVLDVSGSMLDTFDGQKRIEAAQKILLNLADSLKTKYPNVHFALRVFGADYPRQQRNCKDTRLAVPFQNYSYDTLKKTLFKLTPRGMTPIAYTLEKAADDFPADSNLHTIILITDGEENCDGDVCKSAELLMKKRIAFRPFIVGMGVSEKAAEKFKCIGEFVNTHTSEEMNQTVNIIIKNTMNVTSVQVNLLDAQGKPTITNIPFTLYDSETGREEYSFIHQLNASGNPDTLYLNPLGMYDLVVHTYPPIKKEKIEFALGRHNLIAVDVPLGSYTTFCNSYSVTENNAQILVRDSNSILNIQELVQNEGYLQGSYSVDILTLPVSKTVANITASGNSDLKIPAFGTFSVSSSAAQTQRAAILVKDNSVWKKVLELNVIGNKIENVKLQPGEYKIIYQDLNATSTLGTKSKKFQIEESHYASLTLQ